MEEQRERQENITMTEETVLHSDGQGEHTGQPIPSQVPPQQQIPQSQPVPPQMQQPVLPQEGYGMPVPPQMQQPISPQEGYGMPVPPQMQQPIPPQQMGYGMPSYGFQNQGQGVSDGLAIASMVLGIISILACVWFYVGLPCAIVGLILGCVYRSKGGRSGMSIAGIACSSVGIALSLFAAFLEILDYLLMF